MWLHITFMVLYISLPKHMIACQWAKPALLSFSSNSCTVLYCTTEYIHIIIWVLSCDYSLATPDCIIFYFLKKAWASSCSGCTMCTNDRLFASYVYPNHVIPMKLIYVFSHLAIWRLINRSTPAAVSQHPYSQYLALNTEVYFITLSIVLLALDCHFNIKIIRIINRGLKRLSCIIRYGILSQH